MQNPPNAWYRVSVKALIYNADGEFLLCKESNGSWDLPGGWLDHWENSKEALVRELDEEMWLLVVSIADTPECFLTAHKPESKSRPWIANICYKVDLKNLDFKPSDECVEIGFFTKESATTLDLLPNVKVYLNL